MFAFAVSVYNWFAGFIGAILRLLLSAGISLLLVFRLDLFVLTTGYEFLDFGTTYLATECIAWLVYSVAS